MDLTNFSRRNKKSLLIIAFFGASGYGAYKVYNLPSVVRKRNRVIKLLRALISLAEMVSDSAETISVLTKDFNQFISSDSDEIPQSLRQLSKIATSKEFSVSLSRVSEALTIGILRGYSFQMRKNNPSEINAENSKFSDKLLEKLFSKAGTSFVSVVVGSFARNLVLGFYAESPDGKINYAKARSEGSDFPPWVSVICDERCRKLIGDCIQTFVSTAVAVFLDRTVDVNSFDEMFSGLTNPKHQEKVKDILISLCNGAIETFVKTSHQVLTNPSVKLNSSSPVSSVAAINNEGPIVTEDGYLQPEAFLQQHKSGSSIRGVQDAGLLEQVRSTMSVPANRRLVLDVTSRVTFETMRSFVEFLIWRISDWFKRSASQAHNTVLDKGLEVVRYVGAKSSVIITMCIALYLHIMGGGRILLPA